MKYIILVGDGMGDLPLPELGNRTPLEVAETPVMDYLCRHGELFRLHTIPDGFSPGSDVANLSLLGYRPEEVYTGRAPLEAASMGIQLDKDEIAFRCNLVTLDMSANDTVVMKDYSAGHISTPEARMLIESLNKSLATNRIRFYPGVSYRHLLIYKGDLTGLETVPPHDYTGRDVTQFWQHYSSIPEFRELLAKSRPLLQGHEVNSRRVRNGDNPANALWLWGQGRPPVMTALSKQYNIRGALVSAVDLLKGIGFYSGLEILDVPGATGYLDTNYAGKANAALSALVDKDFVFVHVEAPDETGHQGLIKEKIQAIEDFDEKVVKTVFDGLKAREGETDFRLVVAMDHYTPISIRTHAVFPVPIVLFDSRRTDQGSGLDYSERNAEKTNTILENGRIFMNRLFERNSEC